MLIVAGWLRVDPEARADYLDGCRSVVAQARSAPGCLDFALSADLLDPGRINVHERWQSAEHLHAFRGSGPAAGQAAQIRDADVQEYRVSTADPT